MKNFQTTIILLILICLIGYTIVDKIRNSSSNLSQLHDVEGFNIELPDKFDFCGEPVPMKEQEIRERFDRELHVNVFKHASTLLIVKRANRWFPVIERILKEQGMPDDIKYVAVAESGLENVVSPSQAKGYWQFIESAGKEFGLEINDEVDERYHPVKATYAACKYFKRAKEKFGSWTLAAASYNRGMGGIERAIQTQKVQDFYDLDLNNETARYIFRILSYKELLLNAEKYRFKVNRNNLYHEEEVRRIKIDTTITDLVAFAHQQGVSLKTLRNYNPWLLKNTLTVKDSLKRKPYELELPMFEEDLELIQTEKAPPK